MKCVSIALLSAIVLTASHASFASIGSVDAVPAASLLLPYFEVDIGDADGDGFGDCTGINTVFSVNNASAAPALAHFTLWSDWSVATLDFDVFLTGYDVTTVSLCEVFVWGNLPITADVQNDPDDLISPHGGEFTDNPSWDTSFPGCETFFPFEEGILQGFFLDRIQNAHAGYDVPGLSGCMGQELNGSGQCSGGSCPTGTIARGYVTVDNASQCSLLFAGESGYFVDGGTGVVNNVNQLWGDYYHVDPANNFAQGEPLVHIEASNLLNRSQVPLINPSGGGAGTAPNLTGYTFYGRYTPADGADNREPLGTSWATRYLNGSAFDATSWTVWRDSTQQVIDHVRTYPCGLAGGGIGPDWAPMNETQVVCFNEAEDAVELCGFDSGGGNVSPPPQPTDPACFPIETGRYEVGVEPLDPPFDFGWCYLNLNPGIDSISDDVDFGSNGDLAQSYVSARHSALGRFSVGLPAVEVTNALQDVSATILINP